MDVDMLKNTLNTMSIEDLKKLRDKLAEVKKELGAQNESSEMPKRRLRFGGKMLPEESGSDVTD